MRLSPIFAQRRAEINQGAPRCRARRRGGQREHDHACSNLRADAGDDKRGCTILEWGKEPTHHAWPGQPLYRVYKLSDLVQENQKLLADNMHVRVQLDIDISYEEATFIKETFLKQYNIREMSLIPIKNQEVGQDLSPGDIKFESVDQIVLNQIQNLDTQHYDTKLLMEIYTSL